jgi:hypothetical protein
MELKLFKVRVMPELRYTRLGEGATLDSRTPSPVGVVLGVNVECAS